MIKFLHQPTPAPPYEGINRNHFFECWIELQKSVNKFNNSPFGRGEGVGLLKSYLLADF
jgi:hypothetical protein